MDALQAIVLGIVQGLTEFLPISSTAHLRIVPAFFGWEDPGAAFTAVVQLGTMAAVLALLPRRPVEHRPRLAARACATARCAARTRRRGSGWYIILGTIPIAVLGLAFKDTIENEFRTLELIGAAMIVFGVVLLEAERRGRRRPRRSRTLDAARRRASSASRRRSRSSPASAARARRSPPACSSASTARRPRATRSCCRSRRSCCRACSSCATSARAAAPPAGADGDRDDPGVRRRLRVDRLAAALPRAPHASAIFVIYRVVARRARARCSPRRTSSAERRRSRARREASASSASSSVGLTVSAARVSSTSATPARRRWASRPVGVGAQRRSSRSVAWTSVLGAVARRTATSRNHRPASCRPWSSAPRAARRCGALGRVGALALGALAVAPSGSSSSVGGDARLDLAPRGVAAACARRRAAPATGASEQVAVQRRAREGSRRGAQRGAVAERERQRALGVAERSRAQARAVAGATPSAARRAASSSAGGASKRTGWQREAIVGSRSPGRSVSRTRCANGGGSSSVLSSLLAAWSFIVVGALEHEHAPARLERRARRGGDDRLVDVARRASPRRRSARPRSGRGARRAATRGATASGSGAPSASSSAANARATSRLPAPAGPWNR